MFYHDEKKKSNNKIAKQKKSVQAGKSPPTSPSIYGRNRCDKIYKELTGGNYKSPLRLPKSSINGERGRHHVPGGKTPFGSDAVSSQMNL